MEIPLTRIEAEDFTVFEDITIPSSKEKQNINLFVGMSKRLTYLLFYNNIRINDTHYRISLKWGENHGGNTC